MKTGDIRKMFNPRTIAVTGGSEEAGTVGKALLENMIGASQNRLICPIDPHRESLMGIKAYPHLAAVPGEVDLAVIASPAPAVPSFLEECGKIGVEAAVIISAGFREIGAEGLKLEQEIRQIRSKYGMRIIGPHCTGIIRPGTGLNASIVRGHPGDGNIAFISQSGALGGAILDWAIKNHIGFSAFVSLGSMIDIDFGDLIDFLGDDYYTRSIMVYMEGVGDARKFMTSARGFARNKPIVIIKPGRFSHSGENALSHTGVMACEDTIYNAAYRRAGVIRVREVSELFNSAAVLDSKHLPKGRRLAIVTNAGGFGVMATDALIELGGELARFSDQSLEEMSSFMPFFWSRSNPIDVMGDADTDRYMKAITASVKDPGVDAVLVLYAPTAVLEPDALAGQVVEFAKTSPKPVIAAWVGGEHVEKGRDVLVRGDIPTYDTPEEAVKTYLYMYNYSRNLELLYETPSELPLTEAPPKNHLKASIRRILKEGRTILTEEESKDFLSIYGIPKTTPYLARDENDAVRIAERIDYPVILKIVSNDITHKSDVGGISEGIWSEDEVREEYAALLDRVKKNAPEASIRGVNVQRMVEKIDYEVIIGAKKHKDFGTVILFGMGGIGTQAYRDVSVGLPPLNQTLARRLMEETSVYKLLQGYRGTPPANMAQLEQILVSFSNLVVDFPEIAEMDINPIIISDGNAVAGDARIVLDKTPFDAAVHYPHLIITPYPTRYMTRWRLKDGTEVLLRPIRPEDEPLEFEMLSSLSDDTLRTRFFTYIKDITHDMLVRFCNIDYDREMAIVAETIRGDKRRIIGIGRLITEPDRTRGEYAVLVHDDFQGQGLGYKLMDVIIGIAQDKDLEEIYGLVLSENRTMLAVAKKLGFTVKMPDDRIEAPDGGVIVSLTLR
jgi:acetyltransferase